MSYTLSILYTIHSRSSEQTVKKKTTQKSTSAATSGTPSGTPSGTTSGTPSGTTSGTPSNTSPDKPPTDIGTAVVPVGECVSLLPIQHIWWCTDV